MATVVRRFVVCDMCKKDEDAARVRPRSVVLGSKPLPMDVCDACWTDMTAPFHAAAAHNKAESDAPRRQRRLAVVAS